MKAYTICPECKNRIELRKKKDRESFSSEEAFDHYERRHPEKLEHDPNGIATSMPYTPVLFDD